MSHYKTNSGNVLEFHATRRLNKTGMLQFTLTNRSELYPDVLNSVNRNVSNEISQSTYMIKPESMPCSKPEEITRFPTQWELFYV